MGQPDPRTGNIIVELKTSNAAPLLRYSCSHRIIGLPTAVLNARRCAPLSAFAPTAKTPPSHRREQPPGGLSRSRPIVRNPARWDGLFTKWLAMPLCTPAVSQALHPISIFRLGHVMRCAMCTRKPHHRTLTLAAGWRASSKALWLACCPPSCGASTQPARCTGNPSIKFACIVSTVLGIQ